MRAGRGRARVLPEALPALPDALRVLPEALPVLPEAFPALPVFAALIGMHTQDQTERRWGAMALLAGHFRLKYASEQFSSIEINGTFYSMQRPESFLQWNEETPAGFLISVKGSRFITHMLKLRNAQAALGNVHGPLKAALDGGTVAAFQLRLKGLPEDEILDGASTRKRNH